MGGRQVWLDSDGSIFEKMGDIDADYLAWFIWEFNRVQINSKLSPLCSRGGVEHIQF